MYVILVYGTEYHIARFVLLMSTVLFGELPYFDTVLVTRLSSTSANRSSKNPPGWQNLEIVDSTKISINSSEAERQLFCFLQGVGVTPGDTEYIQHLVTQVPLGWQLFLWTPA